MLCLCAAALVAAPACAGRAWTPPAGPGAPAPDAAAALAEATAFCASVRTHSAALRVAGRVGGERLRGPIHSAVTTADQIRLVGVAPVGRPAFVLAGASPRATLWLPRADRVLDAPADAIVEALTGLRLRPAALVALLSGCVVPPAAVSGGVRFGDVVRADVGGARLYLRRRGARWAVTAGEFDGLVVEHLEMAGGWPRRLAVRSAAGRTPPLQLTVVVEEFEVNEDMPPATFRVEVPASALPMTLEELRQSGPLRDRAPGGAPGA